MRRIVTLFILGSLVLGCAGPTPVLLQGDAKSADVEYAADPAATLPIAKAHCASYERVPRLLQAQENVAYYECYKP